MNLATDIYTTLERIPWLSSLGKQGATALDFEIKVVTDRQTAESLFHSDDWTDAKTEAQGDLTGYLAKYHYSSYGGFWNNLAKESRGLVEKAVSLKLTEAIMADLLPSGMLQPILVDINRAALEIAYRRRFPKAPVFFERLLKVYEAGHLPCGWDGKMSDWPAGMVMVF